MDTKRLHVLVIDDLVDMADSTAELLSVWGYDAVACYDGHAAVESARTRRPDVVLIDLLMPRMDGFQCVRLIHELPGCESVPVIAVSGYWSPAYQDRAREAGIHHYRLKPDDPERLREMLTRHSKVLECV